MNNILVTGSKGFIGQNLIKKLKLNSDVNILEFTRTDSIEELREFVLQSDFIYHIAGEVRPTSSDIEFKNSNVTLTDEIINILENSNKRIPILLVSSIHAKLLKNEYGKTKRESEILVERYSINNNVRCFIFRLPHVFGEDCKPNYNSVISTWIYNSIKNLEIKVFDTSIEMHYVYVQDIVNEFVNKLNSKENNLYLKPTKVYETTLGVLVEYINEFKNNIDNPEYNITNNEFKEMLFKTYKDYWIKIKNDS